ncbi:MobF family relaxase [Roseimaritima multifibrata]|nr:MobF family relaxase [Roseimaritima multifibrata]
MLIATQSRNIASTSQYFDKVLTQGDYYLGQEINGQWHGKGTALLGLQAGADVTKEQFTRLLSGHHPIDDTQLTQRNRSDRRPGMDLTFSVPKSVSLTWAINSDERLVDALRETVRETMELDVEPLMQRRVRQGKHAVSEQKATTGKLLYADFLHKTSRPVDGHPDPHLHVHAFVINWTEDGGKHYAGQFEEIVRQRPSLQAKFESRLARRLRDQLGYDVRPTRYVQSGRVKAGWEITGIERSTVEKFSRRTAQVEQHALEKGVFDAGSKAKLGAKTREKKNSGENVPSLRSQWRNRLSQEEIEMFSKLSKQRGATRADDGDAERSLKYALDHHLYRSSTVERHQIIGTALEHALTISPEAMEKALDQLKVIRRDTSHEGIQRSYITTREVLDAERQMIAYARDGRGTRAAISETPHEFKRDWLNEQQKSAVQDVLKSRDTVTAISGGAGTGKSSLMEEAAEAIEKAGRSVFTFAPSTGAKEVLEKKGFKNAQTVEHLIRNEKLHVELKNQVIWVDEAGLLDVRSMNAIFDIAKNGNSRVVLSGDTRQHASPRRGEGMRLLEREAGMRIARVETIQRQKGRYREAIAQISRGHEIDPASGKSGLIAGFDALDRMGKIIEIDPEKKTEALVENYLKTSDKGKSSLVVAPTHREAAEVTEQIRDSLRERKELAEDEHRFLQLKSLNLTEAEKGEATTYEHQQESVVQFHQNASGGIKRGSRYLIAGAAGKEILMRPVDGGKEQPLPLSNPSRFEVYQRTEIKLAAGDHVRLTLGGKALNDKRRLSNGRLDQISGFTETGDLKMKSGAVVSRDYGHVDHGYVITSHASQGKDRDVAIASMGADSLPAVNARQFYVTASRGREDLKIYVDDKAKVRRAIVRSGEQLSASELIRSTMPPESPAKTVVPNLGRERQRQRAVAAFRTRIRAWWTQSRSLVRRQDTRKPIADHGERPNRSVFPQTDRDRR